MIEKTRKKKAIDRKNRKLVKRGKNDKDKVEKKNRNAV